MKEFRKPEIIVSKCLGFAHCRYNGLTIRSDVVEKLKPFVEFHQVCPEVEIGLGVPRNPIRIVSENGELRLVQPETGLDYTDKMVHFSESFLGAQTEVDGFILKNRSPSCGIGDVKVYPGSGKVAAVTRSSGFFGKKVTELFPCLPCEDEGRLTNFKIRGHFFIKLFTLVQFKDVTNTGQMKALVNFQAQNKLLLMAYNQKEMRLLGRIVANPDKRPFNELIAEYEQHLFNAFARPARYVSNINVLMHALGYFSKQLSAEEKAFFLDNLEQYRNGKIPLSVCTRLMKSWIIRFKNEYLNQQTYFEPYPAELTEITDSGKGRDY